MTVTIDGSAGITFPDNTVKYGNIPQTTTYTSGSGTYTTPTGAKYLTVVMAGGGAGGTGSGTTQNLGGVGGNTTFGTSTASGGALSAGAGLGYQGGAGGAATLGSGFTGLAVAGGWGGAANGAGSSSGPYCIGGSGGANPLGGVGSAGANGGGGAGSANTGAGGTGGSSVNGVVGTNSGGGGGSGGYINATITSPAASYSYAVGAGGTAGAAGTSGYAGAAGSAGIIIVTAYFQDIDMTQRYAIIDLTVVVNIIDYDTPPSNPPAGFESPIIAVQSDTAQIGWTYVDGQFIAPPVPAPTPEELIAQCKATASGILSSTDWTSIADVGDPTKANPYLVNQAAFIAYRSTVRGYAVNPVVDPVWPTAPTEQWSSQCG